MNKALPNRILREMVDIHYFGPGDGFGERRRMENLCADQLTRAVEGLLDAWGVPDDQLVSIERLQVNVAGINSGNLESELVPRIASAIKTELEIRIGPAGSVNPSLLRPISRSVFAEILFFLERGHLPWSSNGDPQWSAAAANVLSNLDAEDGRSLVGSLISSDSRLRLVRHFPEETLKAILPLLVRDPEWHMILADIETLLQQLEGHGRVKLKERWLNILLEAAVRGESIHFTELCATLAREFLQQQPTPVIAAASIESPRLRRALVENRTGIAEAGTKPSTKQAGKGEHIAKETPQMDEAREGKVARKPKPRPDGDSIYIRNAGLVILAAYLPAFFRRLGIAGEKQVFDVPAALALQHYLVFGLRDCAEWDLVLNKILCGVPLEDSVEPTPPLAQEQKQEAELLLNAVIANWPALKKSSPDALRATFLQREGVLRQKNAGWQLLLTRTSFDVLMDRLPWTISMIQLPWMPGMLYTDWADS